MTHATKNRKLKTKNERPRSWFLVFSCRSSGFTLVETLVAISILLVAIAGPLTIAIRGLSSANIARDQLIANYLAQEAIEYIRSVRDNNVLQGSNWLAGVGACGSSNGCEVDVPNATINGCGSSCATLKYNTAQGTYGFGSGGDWIMSRFTRKTVVNEISQDSEASITVTVSWQTGTNSRTLSINDTILNWQR